MKLTIAIPLALALFAGPVRADDALERGFASPPPAARPHTWWHWINGNISKAGITADLEAMAKAGIGGAQIFNVDVGIPAGTMPYLSPPWREAMVHAVREADRLGIELCLHNCAGWSSSGGPWITPERSMQILTWSETKVEGGRRVTEKLPAPPMKAGYYRDICVLAIPRPAADTLAITEIREKAAFERAKTGVPSVPGAGAAGPAGAPVPRDKVTVLECAPDGTLAWDAPAGAWTLLRMGHTSTGKDNHPAPKEGRGLECDKLSREAMDLHWEKGIAPILKDLGPLAGKTLNNALIDSYEVGSQNWTPKMREEFQKRCGYDPLPYLPAVTGRVVGSAEVSERFLWDLRRTIADLFAENYVGRFRELCKQNNLLISVEPYGNGTFDELQIGALADIPMGEFWVGSNGSGSIKLAASAAHVTGRNLVGAESFTADDKRGRWLVEPYGIKALGDRMFAAGLNRYIFHRYAHQPWQDLAPGMTMGPWGMHLERTVTWWDQSAAWLRYIARCQYLLQSGTFRADVLTFSGDDAPNGLKSPGSLPAGFDYDGCDRTVLARATVQNGAVVLPGGMRYKVLVLPNSAWMTPATLEVVAQLVRDGATVVGPKPAKSPSLAGYPECDAAVARLAGEVWGDADGKTVTEHRYGRGRIVWGKPLADVLDTPDVVQPQGMALPWIHRTVGDADLYFVSNPRYRAQTADVTFRVSGRAPELWHPETGVCEPAPVWRAVDGGTTVSLRFGPAESVFVVFQKPATGDHLTRIVRESGPPLTEKTIPITIEEAIYEAVDGAGRADVTEKVRALVARGETEIEASNANFGDPTPLHVKRLRVRYTVDGKSQEKIVDENGELILPGAGADLRLPEFELAGGKLLAYAPGTYAATTAAGRTVRAATPGAATVTLPGPWKLAFPAGKGAPARVSLDALASWTAHLDPGVRHFSGTAAYETTFTVAPGLLAPGRALILDLGGVKNFAEVTLNGKPLPTLWKAPFRLDVTSLVRPGANALTVRVTNLWPNRLIGDEQHPAEATYRESGAIAAWPQWLVDGAPRPATDRVAFTTWRFYGKDDPLLESGLLGPVVLRSVPVVELR